MQKNEENIILFPKWKVSLEEESLQALQQDKYEEALTKLNVLLSYGITKHEIVFGKLICLMELERYDEAQDLCEDLLNDNSDNYYHYVHVYLTILFQTSQYDILIEQIKKEFENDDIPDNMKEQFQQLYDLSMTMQYDVIKQKAQVYIKDLFATVQGQDYVKQWQLIEHLRKMKMNPTKDVISLLTNQLVHPVSKTAIFHWLQDFKMTEEVTIHKLDLQIKIKPTNIKAIKLHDVFKKIMLGFSDLEQHNPTLFILLKQMLYRYVYVRYPMLPPYEDTKTIATALKSIGYHSFHMEVEQDINEDERVLNYIDDIKMCETLYSSVIEE